MTRDTDNPLDPFETALLTQLQHQITEDHNHRVTDEPTLSPQSPGHTPRRWASLVLAAAAVTAIAVFTHSMWPSPAFAVTGRNGREVTVKVMRLEGADQLEQALSERGIPADITYLPIGKQCAPNRYQSINAPGLSLSVSADWFKVTIPANAVGRDDTFVLSAAVVPLENGVRAAVEFDIAHGAIAPCKIINAQ